MVNKLAKVLAVVLSIFVVYKIVTFDLFDEDKPIKVFALDANGRSHSMGIYYVPANATRNDYIQLRRVYSNNNIKVLASYERYQQVFDYKQLSDSTLWLILRDTSSYRPRQDTFLVKF